MLEKYLQKLGISDINSLTKEELNTYEEFKNALSGKRITDQDVKNFFETEIENTITDLLKTNNSKELEVFLKVKLDFLRKVRNFAQMPEFEKEITQNMLENQMNMIYNNNNTSMSST